MYTQFDDLIGKTFTSVSVSEGDTGEQISSPSQDTDFLDTMLFTAVTGERYKFYHAQDCCESVLIEEIIGDLNDLVGAPLLMAEEVSSDDMPDPKRDDSYTWTFYRFATIKGYVTVRWLGTSNGYYSEEVNFTRVDK